MDKHFAKAVLMSNAREEEVDAFFQALHVAGYNEAVDRFETIRAEVIILLEQGDVQKAIDMLSEKDLYEGIHKGGQKFAASENGPRGKVCQCEDKDNCPHEYPMYKQGRLLNPMKAGVRYTDDFGNEKW